MASAPEPPKSYFDAMTDLPGDFFPYGQECVFDRSAQAVAYHHGLTKEHVDILVGYGLDTLTSFSVCLPDGNENEQTLYRMALALFKSPVVQCKVGMMFRRINSGDIHAPLARPDSSSTPPKPKRPKLSLDGASTSASVSSASSAPQSATPSTSAGVVGDLSGSSASSKPQSAASAMKSKNTESDSDSSSDSDSDNVTVGGKSKDKSDKRTSRDTNSMVEEVGSEVRSDWFALGLFVSLCFPFGLLLTRWYLCRS